MEGSSTSLGAARGTITSRYSKSTRVAAFESGAVPIRLIDGEKLIDPLIEHGIGVRGKSLELLESDGRAFAGVEVRLGEEGELSSPRELLRPRLPRLAVGGMDIQGAGICSSNRTSWFQSGETPVTPPATARRLGVPEPDDNIISPFRLPG